MPWKVGQRGLNEPVCVKQSRLSQRSSIFGAAILKTAIACRLQEQVHVSRAEMLSEMSYSLLLRLVTMLVYMQ